MKIIQLYLSVKCILAINRISMLGYSVLTEIVATFLIVFIFSAGLKILVILRLYILANITILVQLIIS